MARRKGIEGYKLPSYFYDCFTNVHIPGDRKVCHKVIDRLPAYFAREIKKRGFVYLPGIGVFNIVEVPEEVKYTETQAFYCPPHYELNLELETSFKERLNPTVSLKQIVFRNKTMELQNMGCGGSSSVEQEEKEKIKKFYRNKWEKEIEYVRVREEWDALFGKGKTPKEGNKRFIHPDVEDMKQQIKEKRKEIENADQLESKNKK